MSQIRQLLDLISKNVDALEKASAADGTRLPTLDEPFNPASESFRSNPAAAEAACIIRAAATQLDAILTPPPTALGNMFGGVIGSAALRMCTESHVTEILREAGTGGLHVDEVAVKTGIDAQKLARCLRYLATYHIYKELEPDVFTNNRISSVLDTGKSVKEIIDNPENKYDNTNGFAAWTSMALDEHFKSAAYHWEAERDPKNAGSGDPKASSFTQTVANGETHWEYMARPENAYKRKRYGLILRWDSRLPRAILSAFDWKSLPENALVVDVGGGFGAASMTIAREFPKFKFVVQDISPVEQGIQIWTKDMPDALESGRVKFEAHDFFMPQPQTAASVFLLKRVLHTWSDEYSSKILKRLRDAATPETRLIIIDPIVSYACHSSTNQALSQEAPAPLLPNWGIVNSSIYRLDLVVMLLFNAQQRTVAQFDRLLKSAGWQIKNISFPSGFEAAVSGSIEAVPIL
ncbi:S-adenosyl-L-methionine-dependent methyltransferase [Amanita muscaria]